MLTGKSLRIFSCTTLFLLAATCFAVQAPSLTDINFSGAFVLPTFNVKGKKYVLLGHELGGRDSGTYCAFGGSRDWGEAPVKTAAREFVEESLSPWSVQQVMDYIDPSNGKTEVVIVQDRLAGSSDKKVILYLTHFDKDAIDDLKINFSSRRAKTWFWQFSYREMDGTAAVDWDDLRNAIVKSKSNKGVTVSALRWNPKIKKDEQITIVIRPVQVMLLRNYFKKAAYVVGREPKVQFYN